MTPASRERMRYPGYRWSYGPTSQWKRAGGPWAWFLYSAPDDDGMSTRWSGFEESEQACREVLGLG